MWPGSWGFVVTAATLQDNIRDKLHPIMLSMNYSLVEKPRTFQLGPLSLDTFPVLNQDQSHENETKVLGEHRRCWAGSPGEPSLGLDGGSWGHPLSLQIEFQKECGSDNKCYSNLQLQSSFITDQNQPLPR